MEENFYRSERIARIRNVEIIIVMKLLSVHLCGLLSKWKERFREWLEGGGYYQWNRGEGGSNNAFLLDSD